MSEENPFSADLSSNCWTVLIMGSELSCNLTAAFILINLYSCSIDRKPRPPFSLVRYNTAVELSGCFPPFSLMIFLVCLFMFLSSSSGQCCVHIGYVSTGKANWLVVITQLQSDRGLVQITDNLFKYTFVASVSA